MDIKTLKDIIGDELINKVCNELGGGFIYIPSSKNLDKDTRNAEIISDYQQGATIYQIRQKYNLSESSIRRIISDYFQNKTENNK